MFINGNEVRKGDVILFEGKLWSVLTSTHRTPGNLRAFMQLVLRNILEGHQKEIRVSATEKVEKVDVFTRDMQFVYADGDDYHFMDQESYEQISLSADMLGDNAIYLQPEMNIQVSFYENNPISVKLPQTLEFEVTEAEPEIKGASATASKKNAKISIGLSILVPQFVHAGDRVKINTETGEYMERVKK